MTVCKFGVVDNNSLGFIGVLIHFPRFPVKWFYSEIALCSKHYVLPYSKDVASTFSFRYFMHKPVPSKILIIAATLQLTL